MRRGGGGARALLVALALLRVGAALRCASARARPPAPARGLQMRASRAWMPAGRAQIGGPAAADPQRQSTTELVHHMVRHDLAELHLALLVEYDRFARTIHRITSDECSRLMSCCQDMLTGAEATMPTRGGSLSGRRRPAPAPRAAAPIGLPWRPVRSGAPAAELAAAAAQRALAERAARVRSVAKRVGTLVSSQQARVSALLGSYVHWRASLLSYWLWHSVAAALQPLEPLFSPLVRACAPTLAPMLDTWGAWLCTVRGRLEPGRAAEGGGGAGARRGSQGARGWSGGRLEAAAAAAAARIGFAPRAAPGGGRAGGRWRWPWRPREAARAQADGGGVDVELLQVLAKLRHTASHEPTALGLFVLVGLRLLVVLLLLRLSACCDRLLGGAAPLGRLRQRLLRLALLEATRASERCNRVQRRASLPPLAPPGGWRISLGDEARAAAAAVLGHSARALAGWARGISPAPHSPPRAAAGGAPGGATLSPPRWLAEARRPRLRPPRGGALLA